MLKRDDSRGMSSVITTLLIIMITIVAAGIIWVVIKNIVSTQSELIDIKKEFFAEDLKITSLTIEGGVVSLSLKRLGGEVSTQTKTLTTETTITIESDIVSVVDLSLSMAPSCKWVSQSCCTSLGGIFQGSPSMGNCSNVPESRESDCLGGSCMGVWENRLNSAKEANRELLNILSEVPGSTIGLVAYSTGVELSVDLTDDIDILNNAIDSWQPVFWTCICCGIDEAVNILDDSPDDRYKKIIVMSDGEANYECTPPKPDNAQGPIDAVDSAFNANNSLENLTIYSIGLGDGITPVAEQTLRDIAECTINGEYFSVLDVDDLIDIYSDIKTEIVTSSIVSSRFNYLYIIFYNSTDSYREKITDIPENLGIKSYEFDLAGKLDGEVIKIEIYPVIITKQGKEEIGPLFDSWTLQE